MVQKKSTKKKKAKKAIKVDAIAIRSKETSGSGPMSKFVVGGRVDTQALMLKAIESKTTVDNLEHLLKMWQQQEAEEARKLFFEALARFQRKCPVVQKRKIVNQKESTQIRYRYAPIQEIIREVGPFLEEERLSYSFTSSILPAIPGGPVMITAICLAYHVAGHVERTEFTVPVDPKAFMSEPQKFGSSLTYAKRYAFCNAFGIVLGEVDDDAAINASLEKARLDIAVRVEETLVGKSKWIGQPEEWITAACQSLWGAQNNKLRTLEHCRQFNAALDKGVFDIDTAKVKQ